MRQTALLVFLLPVLGAISIYAAHNYVGEVVVLHTTDNSGRSYETKLWVLEDGHQLWVRSERPTSPWLDRVVRNPSVNLERNLNLKEYRATPLSHRRDRINSLMAERYHWADWLLGFVEDREDAIPVRLDPFVS